MANTTLFLVSFIFLSLANGCSGLDESDDRYLLIGAASSMEPLFNELAPLFKKETGLGLRLVYGASGSLATQIQYGAPLDIFASANLDFIEQLEDQGLISDISPVALEGRLAVVTNFDLANDATWQDAIMDSRVRYLGLANLEVAPYGIAGREALKEVELWNSLHPKLVYGNSVLQILQFVLTGNVDAGFVSLPLASAAHSESLSVFPIEPFMHNRIIHGVVGVSGNQSAARLAMVAEFFEFLHGKNTTDVISRQGYLVSESIRPKGGE